MSRCLPILNVVLWIVGLGTGTLLGGPPEQNPAATPPIIPPVLVAAANPQREPIERPPRAPVEAVKADPPRKADDEPTAADPTSPAEKLARLRRSLENDQRRLNELLASVQDNGGNFARSEEDFRKLDQEIERLKKQSPREGPSANPDDARQTEIQLKQLQEAREKAKQQLA